MSNLPPGITDDDIPGNSTEDLKFEQLLDEIAEDCVNNVWYSHDAKIIWTLGMKAYKEMEKQTKHRA